MLNDKDTTQYIVSATEPRPMDAWLQSGNIEVGDKGMHAWHQIKANAFSATILPFLSPATRRSTLSTKLQMPTSLSTIDSASDSMIEHAQTAPNPNKLVHSIRDFPTRPPLDTFYLLIFKGKGGIPFATRPLTTPPITIGLLGRHQI
jgi:hypothetical protein